MLESVQFVPRKRQSFEGLKPERLVLLFRDKTYTQLQFVVLLLFLNKLLFIV